jgi:glutaminyl-tRNA synthetase
MVNKENPTKNRTDDSQTNDQERRLNFIQEIIEKDLEDNTYDGRVHTRFPPEPNGYLHIGHAKSIVLNFGLAEQYGGKYNLRFDDTNPSKEETAYVEAIQEDIKWLGFDWEDRLYFASDYFDQLYDYAIKLIQDGKAYVDHLSPDEMREYRGTLTEPGKDSPYRNRSVAENLELFEKMRNGEFAEGECVLRAKIDMQSPILNFRDPVLYRIMHVEHHRTGNKWCIYPMYDFAHGQSDSIEGITHSICTLEFENHRPLYDWLLDNLEIYHPKQIEFDRLYLNYTILSKRKLIRLVNEGYVTGWDDPRMPTISGLRRRGYSPAAIRSFVNDVGVSKTNGIVELPHLEYHLRKVLNQTSPRVMAVLNPVKVVIENYPDDLVEDLDAINNPEDSEAGTRKVPFSKVLYIEREDFMKDPPKKFYRLAPGREVRLRYAYFVTCTDVIEDENGEITEIRCTYDPETKGGNAPDGRRVKATLHWVSARHAIETEVRLYENLFSVENPNETEDGKDFTANINPNSLKVLESAFIEPSVSGATPGARYQFERLGYFVVDPDSTDEKLVFNRTVPLRDSWKKAKKKMKGNN